MEPGGKIRKPLRARKTMPLSSRKQVDHLSKLRTVPAGEGGAPGRGRPAEPNGPCPGAQEELRSRGTRTREEEAAAAKEPLGSLLVNSEISIYKDPQETLRDLGKPDLKRLLKAGTLQDLLWYKQESGCPLSKPAEASLESGWAGQLLAQLLAASSTQEKAPVDAAAKRPPCRALSALQQEESRLGAPGRDGGPTVPLGDGQRKRRASSNVQEGDVLCKRSKASGDPAEGATPAVEEAESRLGKVQCLIRNQLEASMKELDQGLRHLNERIDRTQCLRKHEGIAIKIVKKISRLDRHINAVISLQRTQFPQKVKPARAHARCKMLSDVRLHPNTAVGKPPEKPASTELSSSPVESLVANSSCQLRPRRFARGVFRLSAPRRKPPCNCRSSGADVVPCVEAPKPSSAVLAAGAPAPPPKAAAGSTDPPSDQDALVIDLTDEESRPDKEEKRHIRGSRRLGHPSQPGNLPQPARESPDQVLPRFPHLPPLPSVEPGPAQQEGLQDVPPPQKLELVVAQVNQPKGIALQWTISRVDPRCAPIESFSLFICLEDLGSGTTSEWKRTSVIKALPLPMACSLSQFPRSVRCYFTMRAKDIHGRHGPFCEVQCTSAL